MSQYEKTLKDKMNDVIRLAGETLDSQPQSPSNFQGCTSGSRDVRGGELRFLKFGIPSRVTRFA